MAISEGGTVLPTDSAGKACVGMYDGTNLYFLHAENSTSKALRVSPTDSVGTVMKQDGVVGGKMPAVSHYGTTLTAGDTAVQIAALTVVGDSVTSSAGVAATLSYSAPGVLLSHYLGAIYIGYGTVPAAPGTVSILEGATVKFVAPIAAAAGVVPLVFPVRLKFTANTAISIVLSAGGGSVLAYVNANHWTAA